MPSSHRCEDDESLCVNVSSTGNEFRFACRAQNCVWQSVKASRLPAVVVRVPAGKSGQKTLMIYVTDRQMYRKQKAAIVSQSLI